jgi:SNF2 family DNA or RNA helicase
MKILMNSGNERVIDVLKASLKRGSSVDLATNDVSLFAFGELYQTLELCTHVNLLYTPQTIPHEGSWYPGNPFLGSIVERPYRNRLESVWLAKRMVAWWAHCGAVRSLTVHIPQAAIIIRDLRQVPVVALLGACSFSTEGFGLTPGNRYGIVQMTQTVEETRAVAQWFDQIWEETQPQGASESKSQAQRFSSWLTAISSPKSPSLLYHAILCRLFDGSATPLDEEHVIRSATGIKDTLVWKKLYRFQRDGVVGAIEKLERFGGCIIADSVGLGKTFEALAIIKYYELRNDRVLVLCPKRLRENWTPYTLNDTRNSLAADRFNFDVLNHTDLSRNAGLSGDIDLSHINWGNYDLVVIDESHNFRNKPTRKTGETRYDRLMNKIIREGVKTRVLMLSATPVNNRLADLKNQIAFITEGNAAALVSEGVANIETTIGQAQAQFNQWLKLPQEARTQVTLLDRLGFDYFKLLDLFTIARSRKHIEKYYGTGETGRFPERLKPINMRPDVDLDDVFPAIQRINDEIRRLRLAVYAPLRYVLPSKQREYDRKYATEIRGGEGFFRQVDREESLIQLLRVNLLKRMESSVNSFALTLERQLRDVEMIIDRIESHQNTIEELNIEDIDIDDPAFEALLVGRKIKVLLADVDLIRWRQDLEDDRNRLRKMLEAANAIEPVRDAKLTALKDLIHDKANTPINPGNRKIIIFTAFADTAAYLYSSLSTDLVGSGLNVAVVSGTGENECTLPGIRHDMASILAAFSPRSKERPEELASEGEIDILIATDCISEGQNLQDCDYLINYDIHWNPVRIIQRFGRIDRIGSRNERIQLVNFWPNMELDEYIDLERRVSGRMVLLDISATGEENLIEVKAGDEMNDLEYRREQLLKLQEQVIDLEDLSSGLTITDLGLTDFRMDEARFRKDHPEILAAIPLGSFAAVRIGAAQAGVEPGIVFCIKLEDQSDSTTDSSYPLHPYYLIHVGERGNIVLGYAQARQILDTLRNLCGEKDEVDIQAHQRVEALTKGFSDMRAVRSLLSKAISSISVKREERSAASLFVPGGTQVVKGEVSGPADFEVIGYVVVLGEREE